MKADNFAIALRKFAGRGAFKPFVVEFKGGQRLVVSHPEALALRGDFGVYIGQDKAVAFLDHDGVARVFEAPALPDAPPAAGAPAAAPTAE